MKWILLISLCVLGCSESVEDRLGDTQICLDGVGPADAQACLSKINGIERAQAYTLRCSASFITEHFGRGDRIKKAFQLLETSGEGAAAFLGYFTFATQSTASANVEFAKLTKEYCAKSGQKSLKLLGVMAYTATSIASIGSLTWDIDNLPTAADIKNAITQALAGSSAPIIEIGNALISAAGSCQSGNIPNQKLCDDLNQAVNQGQGDPEQVARVLLDNWKQ
jgi:hypothetical protein